MPMLFTLGYFNFEVNNSVLFPYKRNYLCHSNLNMFVYLFQWKTYNSNSDVLFLFH